jgi:hypothetical protein
VVWLGIGETGGTGRLGIGVTTARLGIGGIGGKGGNVLGRS